MKNLTIDNYCQRVIWLEKINVGVISVDPCKIKYFDNIKAFCKMRCDSFDEISYNSLKSAARLADSLGVDDDTAWDKLKFLFRDAKHAVHASTLSEPPILPSAEDLAEKALLDAHICSMAFIELLTFLSKLAETFDKDRLYTADRIRTQLEISKAKFKSLISHADTHDGSRPSLKLIKNK
jgi:hypothetical protein